MFYDSINVDFWEELWTVSVAYLESDLGVGVELASYKRKTWLTNITIFKVAKICLLYTSNVYRIWLTDVALRNGSDKNKNIRKDPG